MSESIEQAVAAHAGRGDWRREAAELLRSRITLLDGKYETLMQLYFEAGTSYRRIARLQGVNEVTVARRIRAMTRRLVSGPYLECLRNRRRLSAIEMSIAGAYYLKGLPIKTITTENGWSYYRIRRTIAKINRIVAESLKNEHK
ncbi:MAG: hypothetical protein ACYS8Z_26910 [Planctomycetota bacterium]|jgi:hypothetical protein